MSTRAEVDEVERAVVNEISGANAAAVVTPLASRLTMAAPFWQRGWARRWIVPVVIGMAVPKCILCLLSYAGLAVSLGLAGPELCGVNSTSQPWLWIGAVLAGLAGAVVYDRRWLRKRS